MTVNLTERQKAVNAEIERFQKHEKAQQERLETRGIIYAATLYQAVGKEQALEFLNSKVHEAPPNTGMFLGPDGVERAPRPLAVSVNGGWVMAKSGAYYGLKGVTADGDCMVMAFEPAMLAACVDDFTAALAQYQNNEGSMYRELGMEAENAYTKCLEELAKDHLNLSGVSQQIYRDARYQAQLTIEAHAKAAEGIAEDRALKKVEGLVRKLSQAAAMPAGLERSMMLEETAPMIRKAFGG